MASPLGVDAAKSTHLAAMALDQNRKRSSLHGLYFTTKTGQTVQNWLLPRVFGHFPRPLFPARTKAVQRNGQSNRKPSKELGQSLASLDALTAF
jgi:hypothetical protein